MEIAIIPIASSEQHWVQENEVFGHTFFLEFEWIERESFWVLHLSDAQQKPLALGIKLQQGWPLYIHHQGESSWALSLRQTVAGAALDRKNLHSHSTLVAVPCAFSL